MRKFVSYLSCFLVGCAPSDTFQKKEARVDLVKKTHDVNSFHYPKENWWQDFQDPYLNECIESAFNESPDMKDAAALIEKANASYIQAGGKNIPNANFNAGYQKNKQSYNMGIPSAAVVKGFQDMQQVSLNFSYSIDLWDQNKETIEASLSNLEARQLSYAQAKMLLATEIARVYVSLDQLYKTLDVVQNAITIRGKTKELFKKRFKEGLENESSYEQANAAYFVSLTEQESLLEQIQLTAQKLCILIGKLPKDAGLIKRPNLKYFVFIKSVDEIPSDLIGRRLDILIYKKLLQVRSKMIDVARCGFYPSFNIVGSIGQNSLGMDKFLKKGSSIATFGPSIQLPIFNQRALDAQYGDAIGEYNRTVAAYESTILKALNEVQSSIISKKAMIKKIKHLEAAQVASNKAYEIANDRYCGGLSTNMEVLRAEDALLSIKRTLTDLYKQAALQEIQLIQSLGGGYTPCPSFSQNEGHGVYEPPSDN